MTSGVSEGGLFGVGGITPLNAPTLLGAGAAGVAAIRLFENEDASQASARAFRKALG